MLRAFSDHSTNKVAQFVSAAKTRVFERLQESIELEVLAAELGVSHPTFRAAFKEKTGYSLKWFRTLDRFSVWLRCISAGVLRKSRSNRFIEVHCLYLLCGVTAFA